VTLYRKGKDKSGLTLALTRRANTLRLLGNYNASMYDIDEALRLSETNIAFQPHYAEALRLKGLNLYRLGESRQAVDILEHSLSLYTAMNETSRIPIVLMETGMAHRAIGDIESARHSYEEALKIQVSEKNLYYQAETLNNLAGLYHSMGEYELACETFENGLACARKSRNQRTECVLLTGIGDLYSEIDEYDTALRVYQQAELLANGLPGFFISNYLILARGALALQQGDLETASQTLLVAQTKLRTSHSIYELGMWNLLKGRLYLFHNKPQKAIVLLQACKKSFMQDGRALETMWSIIWLTVAYIQDHEIVKARDEIENVLKSTRVPNHALLVTTLQAAPYLSALRNDMRIGRLVNTLLEKSQKLKEQLPAIRRILRHHVQSIQMPVANLIIRAFGRPEVVVNGKAVNMSDWRTQSVRDLFFYFLNKREAITKEQVGAVLLPEISDTQTLKKRFKNEIYRLRRAVGRDIIIFDDEYYLFNRELDYQYDVEAFDAYIKRAEKTREINEKIEWYQRAVDLVQGSYLSDVDADWVNYERMRLEQSYSAALDELATLYLNMNQLEKCVSICQKGIKINPYNEVLYQLSMRAYAAMGDRVAIAQLYQACKTTLDTGLRISPSLETEMLFRELTF
jgi:two-component SAPR family response regulator/Tfp pilus assembly protein PilF